MKSNIWSKSAWSVRLLLALTGLVYEGNSQQSAEVKQPKLTVRLFNQARTEGHLVARAINVAKRILNESGIETEWLANPSKLDIEQRVKQDRQAISPLQLTLRIVPQLGVQTTGFRGPLGFAAVDQGVGVHASISYRRVLETAKTKVVEAHQVLGHAMAHEIGHLLLGANSHSADGIMRSQWRKAELRKAELGVLGFTHRKRQAPTWPALRWRRSKAKAN